MPCAAQKRIGHGAFAGGIKHWALGITVGMCDEMMSISRVWLNDKAVDGQAAPDVVLISGGRALVMVICGSMRWCNFKGREDWEK